MKNIILYIALVLSVFLEVNAQEEQVMQVGEKLIYEVSFWGFGLGRIEIYTDGTEIKDEILTYKTRANIYSYKGIPFVSLHSVFKSWVDAECGCSRYFEGSNLIKDKWDYQEITFYYNENYFTIEKWFDNKKYFDEIFETKKRWNDGNSLFFFARKYLRLGKNVKIPTVMDRDTVFTYINFSNKKEKIEIDAVDYPVRTINFEGKAAWKGLYGLSGEFEGWFSDDDAAVPIKASMNVYVGSVDIELIKWERAGWKPPKY
jgi:hypothetical protein